ncbi:uncharacterized protein [Aegilops tauschii subsp. strangulata]|uniref:uncharacterized protein n=1 Tax=Aegilops tauschii subsp. strangulata TaxID=200361 RepID=UPI003CC8980C
MALVPYAGCSGGSVSQPVPVLTGVNYTTWAIKVEADLDAAGLREAVVPPEDAASVVISKKDKPARVYLLRALADNLLLQVAAKKTPADIWSSLKSRFVGADRVRASRLGTLHSKFELLRMDGEESLDAFVAMISGMATRYVGQGSLLDDAAMVKKLLDCFPDRRYAAVARMEQFCDLSTLLFADALGRLKAFDERLRRRRQAGGERADDELLYTAAMVGMGAASWRCARRRRRGEHSIRRRGRRGKCYKCGVRGHFKREWPLLRKEPAAGRALLVDGDVDNTGLL